MHSDDWLIIVDDCFNLRRFRRISFFEICQLLLLDITQLATREGREKCRRSKRFGRKYDGKGSGLRIILNLECLTVTGELKIPASFDAVGRDTCCGQRLVG